MANEKIMNTRIQLKYDSYENWLSHSSVILKAGEVAIAYLGPSHTDLPTPEGVNKTHPVLFKVGDGVTTFANLPWASALAADVYSWAKEDKLTVNKDGTGNVVSGIEWDATANGGKGGLKYTTAAVATAEGLDDLQKAVDAIEKDIADNRADWAEKTVDTNTDTQYRFTTDGDKLVVYKTLYTLGVASTEEKVGEYEFLTAEEVATTLASYYTKTEVDNIVKDKLHTADEIKTIAATEIGRLIDVAGDEETLKSIGDLVDYVENNAGDIAELVTSVGTANTNASNALTAANGAVETANTAASNAATALSTANEAKEAATTAQNSASASASAAAQSATDASNAKDAAVVAQGAAETAQGKAETAQSKAEEAQGKAEEAQEAAEAARNAASGSASAADASAQAAAGSASTASTQAAAASQSAGAAAASKTGADEAKAAAVTAQGAAESAAQTATEKAAAADASAQAASASAQAAATSETNAGNSATAANASAQAAATSEANAAASKSDAEAAKAAAEEASQSAQDSADSASTDAGLAQAAAGEATSAQAAAEAAQAKAEEAQAAAEASNTSATAIANEAKETANAAKTASETATNNVTNLTNTINGYGDIVTHNVADFATAAQGEKADNSKQKQTAIANKIDSTQLLTSLTQNENGEINYEVTKLIAGSNTSITPIYDEGPDDAGLIGYLIESTDTDTNTTYELYVGPDSFTATEDDDSVYRTLGIALNSSDSKNISTQVEITDGLYVDSSNEYDAKLGIKDYGVTTNKIANAAVGAAQTKAYQETIPTTPEEVTSEEVWVFYCGTSSVLV